MTNLSIAWTGGGSYVVYSPTEEGDSNAYNVDLDGPTCNCEHGEMRSGTAACKHIREAVKAHMSHPDLEHSTLVEWAGVIRDASSTLRDAEAALESADEANVAARETQAAAVQDAEADDGTPRPEAEARAAETESAAETLQEAFDEVLDDMQVQTSAGHVWFKTGYDTEEEWPFPGGDETFKVVTSPDCVKYVHDGSDEWADSPHPLYEDMPGEYWKNALDPSDVDQYISEVLE